MNRAVRAAASVVVLVVASVATAQPGAAPAPDPANLRGDSGQTRKRLAEAEQKIIGGKAADAADDLQRVLDESADDLITLDNKQYRTARWVVHSLLAKLPPDALKPYQDRIDQPAKKLLDQAKRDRDPRPLWQLLDRYFVSRSADDALMLLGELLFERGEFRAAENQWRRLLTDAGADVAYPGSKADPALVRARVALSIIFQNDAARAKAAVAEFKAKHPNATGTLASKTGPYANTLQALLDAPPKLPPDATNGNAWSTFGGTVERTGRVPGGIPNWWPGRPTWTESPELPGAPVRQPFGHPVILNGEVFVTDGNRLYSFDLLTGKPTRKGITQFHNSPARADTNCTLSASDGLLYARFGPGAVSAPTDPTNIKPASSIVCLNPKPGELKEVWRAWPPEEAKVPAVWEGAPLVHNRRLWAVYAKFEGGRVLHVAACYDPADAASADKSQPRPVWTAELCDGALPITGTERTRQELLTLAGRNVVFCSNNGAVVALDSASGRRAWGFRYSRAKRIAPGASSDPSPAVAFGGRVFIAPADADSVYALDAETGNLVWESGPTEGARIEGARIVGVSRGRLVVAVAGPVRGIRGLDLETGSQRPADGGWTQDSHGVLSYGQGIVSDDVILWPTREGLYFLDPRTGRPSPKGGAPNPLPGPHKSGFGHIAYADGVLVVVTPSQVCGYRAQSMKIEHLPDTPQEHFNASIDRAEIALASGDAKRAVTLLAEVATSDLPVSMRAWAAARMLQIVPSVSDRDKLPAEIREALRPALLNEWVLAPDGVPVTLDSFLQQRLGRSPAPGSIPTAGADRVPCAPGLNPEADFDRTLKLPPAVSPLRVLPGARCPQNRLFASGPKVLVAIPLDQSAETEHVAADLFTHAADLRAGFVAAGPYAVALYGAAREPVWAFRMPALERLPHGPPSFHLRGAREPEVPQMSSFALAGTWLLARVGEHHLIALDLTAQRVAWVLDSTGRTGYEPNRFPGGARFGPHFAVCGKFVVAQLSDGRRWFVDLRTGKPVARPALGADTARVWWPHAPFALNGELLLADGPGLVRLAQLGGRVKWAFEVEREDGLTGEPAQVRAWGDTLLIAVRRNHGVEIERVDLTTGKSLWADNSAFVDADRIDIAHTDADEEHAYVTSANKLYALALAHGKTAWTAQLPEGCGSRGWIVRVGKSCIIVYPVEAVASEPPGALLDRLVQSLASEPFAWRLPTIAATLYDTWVTRTVPVLLFDPETGKKLGRYDIPARGPAVTAHFSAGATVIATGDRVVWLK